jgi:DNA-binding MarR family transcriptional regulator
MAKTSAASAGKPAAKNGKIRSSNVRPVGGDATGNVLGSQPHDANDRYFVEQFIPYLLNQTATLFNQKFKRDLKSRDMSVLQWRVLAVLKSAPEASLTVISRQAAIDQPTLSRLVDQMVERQLLKRSQSTADARFLAITLTAEGDRLFDELWPLAWKHYQRGMHELSEEEAATLVGLLQKVLSSLRTF